MNEYKGKEYLKRKLSSKSIRVETRYRYYEMKNTIHEFGSIIPSEYRWMRESLGWCAKGVDSLADRLIFKGFKNDVLDMSEIYQKNSQDILTDSAILGALISSCDFIYVSRGASGDARLQVIDGGNATGIIDPITNMLSEGYAVLKRDDHNNVEIEAYFTPEETRVTNKKTGAEYIESNPADYALLVPVIYRPDAWRVFGHSRISRACMSITQSALRTLQRAEIASEFYSYPQRYALGFDADADEIDKSKATISSFLTISRGIDGDVPSLGQFPQQSMTPFIEQLRMFASLFASETGLTMDDLGFNTDNPSSAEAIKASHENLRLTARKAQRDFSKAFINAGYLASCVRDDYAYAVDIIKNTAVKWSPIFEPDAQMLSAIGDGAIKINQSIPGFFDADTLNELTGIEGNSTDATVIPQNLTPEG